MISIAGATSVSGGLDNLSGSRLRSRDCAGTSAAVSRSVHRLAILVLLAGCAQSNDSGSCSDSYSAEVDGPGSGATAVAGTESYAATVVDVCGEPVRGATVSAVADDIAIFTTTMDGPLITLHAHAAGSTVVRFYYEGAEAAVLSHDAKWIDHVQLGSHEDGVPDAFLAGAPIAVVNLLAADGMPVIDSSMTIDGAPPTINVDEVAIDGLTVGDHPLAITAGGQSWSAIVHVVATIDEVVSRAATVTFPLSQPGQAERVCFDARLAGQVVAGAPWQFTFDHTHGASGGTPNCVDVRSDTPVTFTVTAAALGKSTATQVTFQ